MFDPGYYLIRLANRVLTYYNAWPPPEIKVIEVEKVVYRDRIMPVESVTAVAPNTIAAHPKTIISRSISGLSRI